MAIETQRNLVEWKYFMIARGLMYILLRKPFYVYIVKLTDTPVNLPKFMIFTFALNAPTGIIHSREDEPYTLEDKSQIPTQCYKFNSDPTVNTVRYKPSERRDKQVDRHNTR